VQPASACPEGVHAISRVAGEAQSAGNLGIGTTVPSEKLEVNGNVKISPLSGSGNAYACINSAGVIYRSASPCN
jgi:hypothetical protein